MTITINVVHSIDLQTQVFLREVSRLYTPADLQALAELKAGLNRTKAKIDQIDSHLQQTGVSP